MADEVDVANDLADRAREAAIRAARAPIPPGESGDCAECGEPSPRLVLARCAFCRDGRSRQVAA